MSNVIRDQKKNHTDPSALIPALIYEIFLGKVWK